jgi:hypothetical protein
LRRIYALIIKIVLNAIILEFILSLSTNLTFADILYISVIVTAITYVIGDIIILPASNNVIATATDIGVAVIGIYMFNFLWDIVKISFMTAVISGIFLGVGAWFLHKYIVNNNFSSNSKV